MIYIFYLSIYLSIIDTFTAFQSTVSVSLCLRIHALLILRFSFHLCIYIYTCRDLICIERDCLYAGCHLNIRRTHHRR